MSLQIYSKIESGNSVLDRVQDQIVRVVNPALKNQLLAEGLDSKRCIVTYYQTTAQTLASGTPTVINFDVASEDILRSVSVGSAWTFTVPANRDGVYLFFVAAQMKNLGSVFQLTLDLYKNGTRVRRLFNGASTAAGTGTGPFGSCMLRLEAGDKISAYVTQFSGAPEDTAPSSADTRIEICRLTGA